MCTLPIDERALPLLLLCSPLQTELALWWLIAAHAERLGPPWFRRRLADLACIVLPDKNLGRMRDVVNVMDHYSRAIFRKRTEEVDAETEEKASDETKSMLSVLCEFITIYSNSRA